MNTTFQTLPFPRTPEKATLLLIMAQRFSQYEPKPELRLVRTQGVEAWADAPDSLEHRAERNGWLVHCLARHWTGDFGALEPEDWEANLEAMKGGGRVLSAYLHRDEDVKLWIITESDRSVTTLLWPDEY